MTKTRRHLHTIPELLYDLPETSSYVREVLDELRIPYKYPVAQHGIVATVGKEEPVFALRSDMDALPILEEVAADTQAFESTKQGHMHACGHDTHMTMLLGAARLLKAREAAGQLRGSVRLLFQPAEEGGAGGRAMVSEGALQGVAGAHAIHVWPGLPSGTIASRAGTIMAAADRFWVRVSGRGGHGAMPHLAVDPVVAAAAAVGALQPLVARETSPTTSAVVTVAEFNTGPGAPNVIPDAVELSGTVRALTAEHFERLKSRVAQVITLTAKAHGCMVALRWGNTAYGPTVNARAMVAHVQAAVQSLGSEATWTALEEPTMAAEDFSFIADVVPAAMSFLGIRNETVGSVHGLHTPRFRMDEAQLPVGAALHAAVALEFLGSGAAAAAGAARDVTGAACAAEL
ncbi:hypothetical protein WJX81_005563 [Elliptochloris bilobata]|uniref:Peptidase M20 dimerisation domain-containing protein n=1 Tax=Elliptochloris bilobata TaxID=381761 RepID=A0AAW1RSM4_9CHLO